MRHRFPALVPLIAVVLALAGCGGASTPDPYQLLNDSVKVTWNPIQINVGVTFKVAGRTVTLDPKDMAFVIDSTSQKAGVHISIPASTLEIPPAALDSLGIDGDSIDYDLVYTGDALYARSPLMAPVLKMLLGPVGRLPRGDLTGWLKLGTKEELAALSALAGAGGATASAPPTGFTDATQKEFEDAGISLTTAPAVEKHNGVDAHHITMSIDTTKLASNPSFLMGTGSGPQAAQGIALIKALKITGDIWVDAGSKRIIELDTHLAASSDSSDAGDLIVTAHDPDGSVLLDAPTSSVDVPIGVLIAEMMKLVTNGATS